ncbi:Malonyl-CoA decarboxylase, mitochondrial [Halotydeus destructor]|nr:Malonyl-CoA decarboxylase, mitochondrial [Halotydeus destructor]
MINITKRLTRPRNTLFTEVNAVNMKALGKKYIGFLGQRQALSLTKSVRSVHGSALDCHQVDLDSLAKELIEAPDNRNVEAQSQQFCDKFTERSKDERNKFLVRLSTEYSVEASKAESVFKTFLENKSRGESYTIPAIDRLRNSITPAYLTVFNKVGRLQDGVKFLVDLRANILDCHRSLQKSREPVDDAKLKQLKSMSDHLRHSLSLWFSVGLLSLERITWDTPCNLLEKVSEYEAVHPLRNWTDLKRRVGPYRRCYIFKHSCLPSEPLVILHIALTKNISDNIANIVKSPPVADSKGEDNKDLYSAKAERDPSVVDSAIFYSISSPQKGLHGVELGNQMIRQVTRTLQRDFPNITNFSSLSPIPGFRDHLISEIQAVLRGDTCSVTNFIKACEMDQLTEWFLGKLSQDTSSGNVPYQEKEEQREEERRQEREKKIWQLLVTELSSNRWLNDEQLCQRLRLPLMRKCAHYLHNEKRRAYALNSVAHFHMRNGAVMWRLNWLADTSPRGLSNSCGLMVNYRYYVGDMDNLAQGYIERKSIRASSQFVESLEC